MSTQSAEQDQALVRCCGQMTLGTAGGWCVVFDCRTLHLELAVDVSGMACVHGLRVEDVLVLPEQKVETSASA